MLSVDSGGNMRYVSGSGDKTLRGFEQIPRDMISRAGASVVTDRFTALTADRMIAARSGGNSDNPNNAKTSLDIVHKSGK